jgi:SP family facilitated glucose transporter-like MFS transporter 8
VQLFICSGCSAAYIIGALLSWRSLVLVGNIHYLYMDGRISITQEKSRQHLHVYAGLLPCAFLLAGLLFIPESPRWLVMANMNAEFLQATGYFTRIY